MNKAFFVLGKKYIPVSVLIVFALLVFFITRVVLAFYIFTQVSASFTDYLVAFILGACYDIGISACVAVPLVIYLVFQSDGNYKRKNFYAICIFYIAVICLLVFTNIVPKEYNKTLYQVLIAFVAIKLIFFLVMKNLSLHKRSTIRYGIISVWLFISFALLILIGCSEFFFWQEFGSRFNFIAVDYLVYTNEVIGNIKQSYPLTPIIIGILLTAGLAWYAIKKYIKVAVLHVNVSHAQRYIPALVTLVLAGVTFVMQENWRRFSNNQFTAELAGNGIYQFGHAFNHVDLPFSTYYNTIPIDTAFHVVRSQLDTTHTTFVSGENVSINRNITFSAVPTTYNVVLISIESLSASFMKHFGNTQNITPYLDSLANLSWFFTQTYASGTRTVRGLEALSLSIPPLPGHGMVKNDSAKNLPTIGALLKSKGYTTQYLYGGYSSFDNMYNYFSNNGYDVIDRKAIADSTIRYENIWGVSDEDLFDLALQTFDKNYRSGKPFFAQVMTTSNHRPYTYPTNKVDISPTSKSREGAVKYTDYAINYFLKQAQTKPWFANTVFVIVADHCASSAGKTSLPLTGYHIPLLFYAPNIIKPQETTSLTAQIDVVPTILGLLKIPYVSTFYGNDKNIHTSNSKLFISTYQNLGYAINDTLTIQSPVKQINTYRINYNTGINTAIPANKNLQQQNIAYYETTDYTFNKKHK